MKHAKDFGLGRQYKRPTIITGNTIRAGHGMGEGYRHR